MNELNLLNRLHDLPQPYDAEAVARGLAQWRATPHAPLANDPVGQRLLAALFGNSPYLSQIALDDPDYLAEILNQPPEAALDALFAATRQAAAEAERAADLFAPFRRAKARLALLTAVADIGGAWPLQTVTGALSDFAQLVLQLGTGQLLREAAAAGEIELPDAEGDPARGSGLAIIAMGKLGARELNYSSDIDLMIFFDQEVTRYVGRRTARDCFIRLVQQLVKLMQERTGDGYVFRTDLRLRPDPASTPVVMSMAAAEQYYESLGQNWERAALIKARCLAGDIPAGEAFLSRIGPFIWRKHLDFAAIEDIHSIKRQIHTHRGHGAVAVAGHDVKVGRGGIREIEFFAQTQQLIAGGRDRRLRVPPTIGALRALAETDRIDWSVVDTLTECYGFLRRLEHRIQMVADEQTQKLPDDEAGLARIAVFMGYPDRAAFDAAVRETLETVQRHYAVLFEQAPSLDGAAGSLVFTGTDDDPDTLETLRAYGFAEPSSVAATIRGWHHGRYRAMRSTRARELLTTLTPRLLNAFSRTAHPGDAFGRFDEFLAHLPAGIQLFSLFSAHPDLLDLVAEIMGTAPRLAEYLAHDPSRFDAMISGNFFAPTPPADALIAELEEMLRPARDFQDVLDWSRRWANDHKLRIGVALLRGATDGFVAGAAMADLAEAILKVITPRVEDEVAKVHGRVPGAGFAVVGLGRLGSREMTLESDLDLLFIYDDVEESSDGPKPLWVTQYFAKLAQRLIAALTVLTPEGQLFEVDMRLRPSGNAGPVAVGLSGFAQYQWTEAWTWEHMALTRARVVTGPDDLAQRIRDTIAKVLTRPRDAAKLKTDVADMRRRIAAAKGADNPWDVKTARGGLIDIEFVAQYLQLRFAAETPAVLDQNTAAALRKLAAAGCLDPDTAAELGQAYGFLAQMLALMRLVHSAKFDPALISPGLARVLARAGHLPDFATLSTDLAARQARTARQTDAILGLSS